MNIFLTPESLREIRKNIDRSLTDTFQMMFQMDICLLPHIRQNKGRRMIHSYIDLRHGDNQAVMAIAISATAVESIVVALNPGPDRNIADVTQDIVSEIANIVGNHLRSFLSDRLGIKFVLSLPHDGEPASAQKNIHALTLHFRIRENEDLSFDLSYMPPKRKHA